MKKKTKILFTALILSVFLAFCTSSAQAAEEESLSSAESGIFSPESDSLSKETKENTLKTDEAPTYNENITEEKDKAPTDSTSDTVLTDKIPTDSEVPPAEEDISQTQKNSENIFETVYLYATEHLTEIFSLLSLMGTFIVGWFYKKGLIPSVEGLMTSLKSSVSGIKESADRQSEAQLADRKTMTEAIERLDTALAEQSRALEEIYKRMLSGEQMIKRGEMSDRILLEQVDMLYDIFMTSSLPHYQKEATGERLNKMKKELEEISNG